MKSKNCKFQKLLLIFIIFIAIIFLNEKVNAATAYEIIKEGGAAVRESYSQSAKEVWRAPKNSVVMVTEKKKNSAGNLWYKLSNGNWIYSENVKLHSCSWTLIQKVNAMCSSSGFNKYKCDKCGVEKVDNIKALGHSYSSHVCSRCGVWDKSSLKSTSSMNNVKCVIKTEGTKVHNGPYGGCATTSTLSKGTIIYVTQKVVNASNNVWYKYDGGYIYSDYLQKHTSCNWNSGKITKAATCTSTGVKTYTCSNCNATKKETIPINKTKHKYSKSVCIYCGEWDKSSLKSKTSMNSVKYAVITDGAKVHSGPYGDCKVVKTLKKGTVIKAKEKIVNSYNNIWYKYDDGYIYIDNVMDYELYTATINLNKNSVKIYEGKTETIKATVKGPSKTVKWKSSNTDVAVVDSKGVVTAKKEGKCTITATANGKSKSCTIQVEKKPVKVSGIKLNCTKITLEYGKNQTLKPTISPNNATNKNVTWSSSNTKVATVNSNGQITAKAKGKATITAKTNNGKTATCEVNVVIPVKNVKLNHNSYTYDGKEKNPTVTVEGADGKKIPKSSYTVKYSNNKNVGTASVTVTCKGDYTGTIKKEYKINPVSTSINEIKGISKGIQVKCNTVNSKITGYQVMYATDKDFKENKGTVTSTSLDLTISNLKVKQKYYVRVRTYKVVNNKKYYSSWSSAKTVYTKLETPVITSVDNDSSTSLKIKWNKVNNAVGYQIYRTTEKNGKYKLISTVKSATEYVDKKLKTKTTYYYKVVALASDNVLSEVYDSKSARSKVASCKVKYDITEGKVEITSKTLTYTGKEIVPKFNVLYGKNSNKLVKDTDFTVKFNKNVDAGTASLTIKGKGNYYGVITKKFKIEPKKLGSKDIKVSGTTFINNFCYPQTVKYGDKVLVNSTDFTFENGTKVNDLKNKVTIKLKGNYSGSITVTYNSYTPRKSSSDLLSNSYYTTAEANGFYSFVSNGNGGNCTWYAWGRAYEISKNKPVVRGNAGDWYNNYSNAVAKSNNYKAAKPGSIIVWNNHVAVVEEVLNNGIVITESSYGGIWYSNKGYRYQGSNGVIYNYYGNETSYYSSRFIPWETIINGYDPGFLGYIYLL